LLGCPLVNLEVQKIRRHIDRHSGQKLQQTGDIKKQMKQENNTTINVNTVTRQFYLCQPANSVKNSRILLEQSFNARMILLKSTSTFRLGRKCLCSSQQCHLHRLHTIRHNERKCAKNIIIYYGSGPLGFHQISWPYISTIQFKVLVKLNVYRVFLSIKGILVGWQPFFHTIWPSTEVF